MLHKAIFRRGMSTDVLLMQLGHAQWKEPARRRAKGRIVNVIKVDVFVGTSAISSLC
jgi:hypothetical protein